MFWLFFSLVCLFDVLGITLGKHYSLTQNNWYLAGAAASFTMVGLFFALSLNYKGIALANIIWAGFATILITSMGYFFFKETITSLQLSGIVVILLGLVLVNY
jgi:multidrug transporter EmrE-like cation transporter